MMPRWPQTVNWTPALLAEIHERRMSGDTLTEIANDLHVTRERVRQKMRQAGLADYRRRARPVKVKDCKACGGTYVGMSAPHRQSAEHKKGLLSFYPEAPMVLADYKAGVMTKEIQRKYGLNPPQMYRILRHGGVPKRGKPFDVAVRASVKTKLNRVYRRYDNDAE